MYILSPSEPSLMTSSPGLKLFTTKRSTIMAVCSSSRRPRKSFFWMALTIRFVSLMMRDERSHFSLRSLEHANPSHIMYVKEKQLNWEKKAKPLVSPAQMGYSLPVVSTDYQPGSFLDLGAHNLQGLGDRFGGDDSRTALPELRFNLITALRGKLWNRQTEAHERGVNYCKLMPGSSLMWNQGRLDHGGCVSVCVSPCPWCSFWTLTQIMILALEILQKFLFFLQPLLYVDQKQRNIFKMQNIWLLKMCYYVFSLLRCINYRHFSNITSNHYMWDKLISASFS